VRCGCLGRSVRIGTLSALCIATFAHLVAHRVQFAGAIAYPNRGLLRCVQCRRGDTIVRRAPIGANVLCPRPRSITPARLTGVSRRRIHQRAVASARGGHAVHLDPRSAGAEGSCTDWWPGDVPRTLLLAAAGSRRRCLLEHACRTGDEHRTLQPVGGSPARPLKGALSTVRTRPRPCAEGRYR